MPDKGIGGTGGDGLFAKDKYKPNWQDLVTFGVFLFVLFFDPILSKLEWIGGFSLGFCAAARLANSYPGFWLLRQMADDDD